MNGFDGTNKSPPDGEEVNYALNSIVTLEPRSKSLPNYPLLNYRNSLVVMNDGNVLSLGGRVTKNCYILTEKSRKYHSTLAKFRNCGVTVTMPNGVYVFGGFNSYDYTYKKEDCLSSEFLPNGSQIWQNGPDVPDFWISYSNTFHNFFPSWHKGITSEHAHKISEQELIIVRGDHILRYNIKTQIWDIFCHLGFYGHDTSSIVFGGKLYRTGGRKHMGWSLPYTEVVDLKTRVSSKIF